MLTLSILVTELNTFTSCFQDNCLAYGNRQNRTTFYYKYSDIICTIMTKNECRVVELRGGVYIVILPNEFNNKIRAALPHKSHYKALGVNTYNKSVYQDCRTQMLRIVSPETEPWGKEWDILLSFQRKKSDRAEYDSRLDLKLFYPEDDSLIKATLLTWKDATTAQEMLPEVWCYDPSSFVKIWALFEVLPIDWPMIIYSQAATIVFFSWLEFTFTDTSDSTCKERSNSLTTSVAGLPVIAQ